ncbi:lipopolysaccharide heptosyltransferase II [Pectinatus haikarae]|uniref:lipopolysaccharide heptosyltransferase II n=1 Tax=Pectinatus haikarae TaxID=349096 RepID=A0ABT9Y8I8_9FIRM|nr:lipopolysaccharide heptosyltransferase II [Pectinatus haikarae]MDQ0203459.1 heptosyltransferase-1 [Pectinatus haikarae]
MKNILIIKLSAIGDVIHALPVAAAVKKTWPDCHLTWVVSPVAADIVNDCPAIDEIIIFDRKKLNSPIDFLKYMKPFSARLNKRRYDISIDLQGLLKSALIAWLAHAAEKVGYTDMREGSGIISTPLSGKNHNGHIVERYLDVVRRLGGNADNPVFPLGITEDNIAKARSLLFENKVNLSDPYVVLVVGANWPNKRWPASYFAELIDWCCGKKIIPLLAGAGKTDRLIADKIKNLTQNNTVDLVGQTALKELAFIIKNASATVGGDTGSLHMAAALGKPAIMIMGPTDANRNGPYNQKNNYIEVAYDCRHCWKRKCRFNRDCLASIEPQQVINKLTAVLR